MEKQQLGGDSTEVYKFRCDTHWSGANVYGCLSKVAAIKQTKGRQGENKVEAALQTRESCDTFLLK